MSLSKILSKNYYDTPTGLYGADKLFRRLKPLYPNITLKQVQNFINNQATHQIYKQVKRPKYYYPIMSYSPFYRVQIDLMDMSNQPNRGFKWLFNLIDVYSRYAISIPLKNKGESECARALKEAIHIIMDKLGFDAPQQIDSDYESGFLSAPFKKVESTYSIQHDFTKNKHTMGIVERFNGTLRGLIERLKEAYRTNNWIDNLQNLLKNYNSTYHSTIKTSPEQALDYNEEYDDMIERQKAKASQVNRTNIEIGDKVRVLLHKTLFQKGSEARYSKDVHTVDDIEGINYFVSGRVNPYRKNELQLVKAVEEYKPEEEPEELVIPSKKELRTTRRITKEGLSKETIEKEPTERQLRKYRKAREFSHPVITDY